MGGRKMGMLLKKNRQAMCFLLLSIFCNLMLKAQTPDPGLMGTHTVIKAEYNLGETSFVPPAAAAFPANMEEIGSVHYPADLSSGPFPVILYLHGRHETCYDTTNLSNTSSVWPCAGTYVPIVSYEGYDYSAEQLASHGYIVISISANAINAIDGGLPDAGMNARGVLVQHHLDLWNTWNTVGGVPFGSLFVGKLDMQNIGLMGHSRGGEGVVYNVEYNRSLGSPYGIKAVLTLAPVDFYRHVITGVPLLNIAPYCDGDVTDLEGVHFYDDARYLVDTDETPKHTILFLGANHNYFNTVWTPFSYIAGGSDDWLYYYSIIASQCGEAAAQRFDTSKQKAAYLAYSSAFFRLYLGHELAFAPILQVSDIVPPASSMLDSSNVFVTYHPGASDRLDVNRTDSLFTDTLNSIAGSVTTSGLLAQAICGGGIVEPSCGLGSTQRQEPHKGNSTSIGLSTMKVRWHDTTEYYENDIPASDRDLTGYKFLQFRAAVNYHEIAAGTNLDFTVQLIDTGGNTSNQLVSNHSYALYREPGNQAGDLPKVICNTINIPLDSFSGIDIAHIQHVKFLFNRIDTGSILFSDLAFTNPLCGNLKAAFSDSLGTHYFTAFNNKSTYTNGDSVTYLWNFGDILSGISNSSTLRNATHIFSGPGTYHPCLYVTSQRKNGFTCTDSVCSTITLLTDGFLNLINESSVILVPNPAKDYFKIVGATNDAILKLLNLYGQEVFKTVLNDQRIIFPSSLPSGVYFVEIFMNENRLYKRLVIEK